MISWTNVTFLFLFTLFHCAHNLDYSDLEALGLACPKRDKCSGYRNDKTYLDRSCECDPDCTAYRDCCIDVKKKTSGQMVYQDFECLPYGDKIMHSGVYGLTKCDRDWNGPTEIKEKCEGPVDISDPMSASPVTSRTQRITYKNLYCAECNYAEKDSLKFFLHRVGCEGIRDTPKEEIMNNISYNRRKNKWGVNIKSDERGNNTTFVECKITFDVPTYLNRSVRFCRANIISKCARNWTRPMVKKSCQEYMSVVYDKDKAYRNPHCAICNHKVASELSCSTDLLGRKRPFSFSDLIDINRPDKSECPKDHILDPYSKRCRKLSCALPGYVVQNNRCVKGV